MATQKNIENTTFLWLLLLVSVAFLWLLKPLFGPIFWACVIAMIFHPLQDRLSLKLPDKSNTVSLLTLGICLVIVVIPMILLISAVISEGIAIYNRIESGELDPGQYIEQLQTAFPQIQGVLESLGLNIANIKTQFADLIKASSGIIAKNTLNIGQNTFAFFLNVGLMLYLAFFMLRDGETIIALLIKALPLGDTRERHLFDKFVEVTRATVKGNLVVAMVQGGLGGLILWVLGISGALLWGTIMMILSLIPMVGAGLIWAPVAIYLLATGAYIKGIILILFGVGVIGLVDNILRPILVGRDTKLPDYIVLFSTLSGLTLFGINGFVMGPLLAALFFAFWGIFIREFQISGEP